MKLDKKLQEKHAKRLSAILNPQSTFAPHLTRPEFMNLLKIELNTLGAIEKIHPDDKLEEKLTASYLSKQFETLTKTDFKLGDKFKYEDEDDLIDNINYLPTYCKNIFKVNIDDVAAGKKVVAEDPNINLRSKPDMDDPSMDAAAAFNMGAMGYAGGPYENPFIMGKAYGKLNKDISEGKVYQYKTKPRIIVICKWLLIILLGLGMLSLIVTAIFCFMANGIQIYVDVEPHDRFLGTITNGIFYIICAGFGVYVFYVTLKSILKKNGKVNENSLYQFSWYFYLAFIILTLLITLLDLRYTWFYESLFKITEAAGSSHSIGFWGWKIGIIVTAGATGLCIVPMILGAVFAPKQDKDKLEQLVRQYVDQATSTYAQTGPEVRKPVDVKPSEPKKDEPKKDSEKPKKS